MRRFVYSPDVQAYIATQEAGTIDVSEDIVSGSVTRNRDQASSAQLVLQNPYRKYLRKLKPMDRIAIYLTRTKPMLVFTGYIDRAPVDQLYPGTVTINATCTLKRLLYTFWDPSLPYVMRFFEANGWTFDSTTGNIISNNNKTLFNFDYNGSIGHVMREVLWKVGGWPIGKNGTNNTVHILGLPPQFLQKTQSMIANAVLQNEQNQQVIEQFLNNILTANGLFSTPFDPTKDSYSASADTNSDSNPLPAFLAKSYLATIYGPKYTIGQMPPDGTPWQKAILYFLGAPDTPDNIQTLNAWATQEGGWDYNNPMNTSLLHDASGITLQPNGNFPYYSNASFGIAMTASTLLEAYYPYIVAAFQSGNGSSILTNPNCQSEIGTWGTNLAGFQQDFPSASTSYDSSHNFSQTDALTAAQALGTAGLGAMPGGTTTTSSQANQNNAVQGNIGDVKVGSNFFQSGSISQSNLASQNYTFRISPNPWSDSEMIFMIVGQDSTIDPEGISIYIPLDSPQAQKWKNQQVSLQSSINLSSRFPSNTGTPAPPPVDVGRMTNADLTHGGGASTSILSPVAKQALGMIQSKWGPFSLINSNKNTIDLVPVNSNGTPDYSKHGYARLTAAAQWAGWYQNNNGTPSTTANPAVQYVDLIETGGIVPASDISITGFVHYDQDNYNNPVYLTGTIAYDGCGPTSAAMVIATLTGRNITPVDTGNYMTANNGYIATEGATTAGLIAVCQYYGLQAQEIPGPYSSITPWNTAASILENGGYVIAQGHLLEPYSYKGHVVVLQLYNLPVAPASTGSFTIANPAPNLGSGPFTPPLPGTIALIQVTGS